MLILTVNCFSDTKQLSPKHGKHLAKLTYVNHVTASDDLF